jgi:hypothetical protein
MYLDRTPIFERLADASSVLIAGAGGGFDFFSGLPLYFGLRERGQEVHLGNLSWSRLERANERRLIHGVTRVDADSEGRADYFPEAYLSQWFRTHGEEIGIWCFPRLGGRPLTQAYEALVAELGIDAVVLVDGGTDILMRGDEERLGTPWEDIASLAAVDAIEVPRKFVTCLGFGVDAFHGVCHAHVLEAVAASVKSGGFLGAVSLLKEMPEVRRYLEAVEFVNARMPRSASIVCSSIVSALEGEYGDHHRTERTAGSELWINPLMTLFWAFELEAVARRCIYLDAVKTTEDMGEITRVIHESRLAIGRVRPHVPIPV